MTESTLQCTCCDERVDFEDTFATVLYVNFSDVMSSICQCNHMFRHIDRRLHDACYKYELNQLTATWPMDPLTFFAMEFKADSTYFQNHARFDGAYPPLRITHRVTSLWLRRIWTKSERLTDATDWHESSDTVDFVTDLINTWSWRHLAPSHDKVSHVLQNRWKFESISK